jgi:predicted nuclease of predicted toxin-antitoxin system
MRLLLDQGTPRSTARHLAAHGIDAVHAADIGLSTATERGMRVPRLPVVAPDDSNHGN